MSNAIPENIRALMSQGLAQSEPYDPSLSSCEIMLATNENNFGLPFSLKEQMQAALAAVSFERYPDPLSNELRDLLAEQLGLSRNNICVGNGGDELLFNLFLLFGGRGKVALDVPPSFPVYKIYGQELGTHFVDVPRDEQSFAPNIEAVVAAASTADLVLLTSPNNPTGDLLTREQVSQICEACPGIVLVDEAYIEFAPAGASVIDLLERFERLVILRTFSKAYALAGVRCGYILSSPGVIAAFEAARQPYSVNRLSQAAAQLALQNKEHFAPFIDMIVSERGRVSEALAQLDGLELWQSWGNFVLVRTEGASELRERMRDEYSILVRDLNNTPGCTNCLRISIGKPPENDRLIAALGSLLEERA